MINLSLVSIESLLLLLIFKWLYSSVLVVSLLVLGMNSLIVAEDTKDLSL
jgi:hypothetical protein